jgi:actin-related protein
MGEVHCFVSVVYEGFLVLHATTKIDLGGRDVTLMLAALLRGRGERQIREREKMRGKLMEEVRERGRIGNRGSSYQRLKRVSLHNPRPIRPDLVKFRDSERYQREILLLRHRLFQRKEEV